MKVFARKKPALPAFGRVPGPLPIRLLQSIGAEIVDNQDSFLLVQLSLPNASAAPQILRDVADVVEVLNDFDLLKFLDLPIDAREPASAYPVEWERHVALPSPARDAFVIQFATVPRSSWIQELKNAGATVLDYVPHNGYVVLADQAALQQIVARLPVQLSRLHQPFHKVSARARTASGGFADAAISIANVPEAAEVVALLTQRTLAQLRPPEHAGDRTFYRVTVDRSALPQLAALPALLWIDLYTPARPSGEREAHLTLGDTLVSNPGGVLQPVAGDHRQWIASKGLSGPTGYKTALKMAILDTGFDTGSSFDVHPDFKDSAGNSFVTVRRYTIEEGSDADCYGHGTFVAGVLAGNAGASFSTQTRDVGDPPSGDGNYYMGLGILPEMPVVVGRIFNYLPGTETFPVLHPQDGPIIYGDLANMGVAITSNSWNFAQDRTYTMESQTHDRLVRSANGVNGGPPMSIYFSGGNAEGAAQGQPRVSAPATAKNVISVGGSENFNRSPYPELPDPPFTPSHTGGIYADNGNQIWDRSQIGLTLEGRLKPDVVAPASATESPRTRNPPGCRTDLQFPTIQVGVLIDPSSPVGQQHLWSRGTSFSAPLAAGAGALLYTWFKNTHLGEAPKPALLKAMQINFARDLSGTGHPPDASQGWGKADLERAFATDGRYVWNNELPNTLLTNVGQIAYLPAQGGGYRIKDTSKPVRITVVWTDAFGPTGSGTALVNDLDLTVRMQGSGDGRRAFGNDFNPATGRSNIRTSGGTPDPVNNVEQAVFTYADASADHFGIEVFAKTLAGDGINPWSSVAFQQNFALFIDNAVVNQNNAAFVTQSVPSTVAAGAPFTATVTMQNTGDTPWTEGINNFYRLASVGTGNPFGGRVFLGPSEVINPGQSKTFTVTATAPYAAGTYPFQWQMVEELVQFFGAAAPLTNVNVTPSPYSFYTLTPCRVVDTRNPDGPYGGPALLPSSARLFVLRGQCGIPSTATAVSVNLVAVSSSADGFLTAYPANIAAPGSSTLNYRAGGTRANNAFITLDTAGQFAVSSSAATHMLLDVNGYFQ